MDFTAGFLSSSFGTGRSCRYCARYDASPGRSALNTCASGFSFQSKRAPANAELSPERPDLGKERLELNGKSSKESQRSVEEGSVLKISGERKRENEEKTDT